MVDKDNFRILTESWKFAILDRTKCKSPWLLSPLRNLLDHDNMGGHTCTKHVNLTIVDLKRRLTSEPNIQVASSFWCIEAANATVCYLTMLNLGDIIQWIESNNQGRKVVFGSVPVVSSIGYGIERSTYSLVRCFMAEMIIQRIPSHDIFRIVTAYPRI